MQTSKKIALIGNMNNMLFQQQRYFQDWGHDTTLFLFEEYEHFMPHADTFFNPSEKYKIVNLGWNIESFHLISKTKIRETFSDFDVLIGTDVAPAYLYKGGFKLDIFCLHGNDLYQYPFFRIGNKMPSLWEINRVNFSLCQFEGVKLAQHVALYKSEELYEKPLRQIGIRGKRIASPPFIYLPQFTDAYFSESSLFEKINELKSRFGFIILHHCSHNWYSQKTNNPLYSKGNDRLIEGFAHYCKKSTAAKKACLVMLDYGPDTDLSKKMIQELGISEFVYWLPRQHRKDLMCVIKMCDIGVGELGDIGWVVYSVIVEFILMSKPLIHYRNSAIYADHYNGLYEMVDTNSPAIVAQTFLDYEKNPQKYRDMGVSANTWYLDKINKLTLNDFDSKIKEAVSAKQHLHLIDYLCHSNKTELLRTWILKLANVFKIKLKLAVSSQHCL